MSEWKEVYLNEAYSICSGISKPAKDFGSGFPFLSFKDVFNNFFVPKNLSELVESTDKERANFSIKRGDVFLTRTSETVKELGMSCVALKDYENATFNGFTKRLRPNKNFVIVPEYAGYYFRTYRFRSEVTAMSSASTRASLNNEMLGRLKIILPSETEQKQIADILFCLDDKIDNLRRQNETLEKIAQTLFKHWFIDFEFPNDDGKPYKSSGGAMIASELGNIPAVWRVGKLGDYINIQHGYNFKSEDFTENGNPVVRMGNFLVGGGLDFSKEKTKFFVGNINKKFILKPNDLVIALSDVTQNGLILGNPGFIPYDNRDYLLNQRVGKVCINKFVNNIFLYCLMKTKRYKSWVKNSANSTTVLNTSPSRIGELLCVLPFNEELLDKLETLLKPIFGKIANNTKQIQTLTKTRDTLLPKLMSGEIRIKEA